MEEWRRVESARRARDTFDFTPWCEELLELFVGRGEQVRKVAAWARQHERQNETGLCWLHGSPGVGKSAFMADLVTRFFTDSRKVCRVVHFFRSADSRCNRMQFL